MFAVQGPGNNVPSVLKILNSRLGAEGNLNDSKDAAYFNMYVAISIFPFFALSAIFLLQTFFISGW
jgi:hypothetical protein